MRFEHWLILLLTVLELSAALGYSLHGDWRHGLFWTCAACMNVVITW